MAKELDLGQVKEPFLVDREASIFHGSDMVGSSILSKYWGKDI